MKVFTQEELELFSVLAKLSQPALRQSMGLFLQNAYGAKNVVITNSYIYAKGLIPICLIAHLDTVHRQTPTEIYFDKEKDVLWSPQGIGADDRAGVFAIVSIIKSGLLPHVIFTTDEEKGCIGSMKLSMHPNPFSDLRYMVQIDRRGSNDCVFYDCDNKQFNKYIESFGFKTDYGTYTDISELSPEWGIAGVNLSSGYYNEHTLTEYLKTKELKETIRKIKKMLTAKNPPKFKYIYGASSFINKYYNFYSFTNDKNVKRICGKCGVTEAAELTLPVLVGKNQIKHYCGDCLAKYVNWCAGCGQPYDDNSKVHGKMNELCPLCKEEMGTAYGYEMDFSDIPEEKNDK